MAHSDSNVCWLQGARCKRASCAAHQWLTLTSQMEPSLLTGSKPGILGTPEQLGMARVKGAKRGKRKAAAVTPAGTAAAAPALPPDVLTDIAGRAFELKGCTLAALSRFSAVCVAWRNHLKGEHLSSDVCRRLDCHHPHAMRCLVKSLEPSATVQGCCSLRGRLAGSQSKTTLISVSEIKSQHSVVIYTTRNRSTVVASFIAGLPVVLKFAKAMRPEQLSWLCKTLQPVRTTCTSITAAC